MLFAVDSNEDLIYVEGVPITTMLSLQSVGINGTEFDTPKSDSFGADDYATFRQEIINIAMAQVEAIVEPDGIGNDIWRESVTFIGIHEPILSISGT